MPITERDLRNRFGRKPGRKPAPKPADRITFTSSGLVPPQFRERRAGWEGEFFSLLSPATAELLRAELAPKD